MQKPIIGRKDKIDFPDFNLENVSVKIDSGAYSCSIHCEEIREVLIDGVPKLEVIFLDNSLPKYTGEKFTFEHFSKKNVKSSTGEKQERYFIECNIVFFGKKIATDFSLTKRNGLKNPILIGRKVLNKQFLIDTDLINVSYKAKMKSIKTA